MVFSIIDYIVLKILMASHIFNIERLLDVIMACLLFYFLFFLVYFLRHSVFADKSYPWW